MHVEQYADDIVDNWEVGVLTIGVAQHDFGNHAFGVKEPGGGVGGLNLRNYDEANSLNRARPNKTICRPHP